METRKRRVTLELEGKYLEGIEDLSKKNFRQVREQICAILHSELVERGVIEKEELENFEQNAK